MKSLKLLLYTITVLSLSISLKAQIHLDSPVPVDPEVRTGKLANGLTYFVRKNKEPEKRASFYLIQNVGAILENDDQNGLAHFLEHMAFNGTENFPGKSIISSLEKHGVKYGANINAGTSFDETVYNLSNVPVDVRPDLVDTCLLILADWSEYIKLEEKEIDLERGVILEEWRAGEDASTRMLFKQVLPVLMKDSKYAVRDIIGDPEIIKSFPYSAVRDFYRVWYRTDLQAVAVVGDINVDEVETKIKTLFSKIKAVENAPVRYAAGVPWHRETYFVLATDKEAPSTSVSVIALQKDTPGENRNHRYLRDSYAVSLMNSMINTRIGELLQKGNPPFANGSISLGSYIRGYDAFSISATARKNEEAIALEAIYTEAERARRYGFTKSELDRAKARLLTETENTLKQKDKISNDTYANWIRGYFLTGEPLTSADFDYEFLTQVIDGITPEEITEKFRQAMTEENRTIVIQGIEDEDVMHLSEEEALGIINKVKNTELAPYADEELAESLVKKELKGSSVIKTVSLPQFDAVEWTLANNIKVVYRKAGYEKDNVLLAAFSFGGISKLDDQDVLAGNLLSSFMSFYGAGDYDNITLQKMLAGKKASVSVALAETTDQISGSSTPGDFETMMQLLYLQMAEPRFDREAHDALIVRYTTLLGNMENNPDKRKSDSVSLITTGYNPRTPVLTKENINKITIDNIEKIFTDRINGADEFIFFIVGNISQDTVIPLVEKYIGSLPLKGRTETWIDRGVEQPDGKITREISFPLTIPKSTVFIAFEKEGLKYNPYYNIGVSVVSAILDLVYTEKIREEEGGTYGVSISLSSRKRPNEAGEGYITFDCDPARANELKKIVYAELDNLVKNGPGRENLDKAVTNMLKTREESKLHNAYWLNTLTRYYSYGINSDDPKNYEDVLKSYSSDDIKKIARKLFKKADVLDLVFIPEE